MKYELLLHLIRLIKVAVTVLYGAVTFIFMVTWPLFWGLCRGMFHHTPRKK